MDIRQNTATTLWLGALVTTSGITSSTAFSVTWYIAKNNAAFAASTGTNTGSTALEGFYKCPLTATNVNTLGELVIASHSSANYLYVWDRHKVVTANYWDTRYGADKFQVDVMQIVGSTSDADDLGTLNDVSTTDILTQVNLSTEMDDIATVLGALNNVSTTDLVTQTRIGVDASTQVDDIATVLGALNDAVDVSTDVNDILTNIAGLNNAVDTSTDVNDILTNIGIVDGLVDTLITGIPTTKYMGSFGPGVYIDSGAANVNTVTGTDGIVSNPVSTFAAARTIADAIGTYRYYIKGNSDITLAATHVDWEFCGIGAVADNIVNFGSQDVSRSRFCNLTLEGTQGGSGRIEAIECALQDPGAGATTLHIFALRCGLVDAIEIDTSNNNVFEACYSLVAGATTPLIIATGAAGTLEVRHYSGGLELKALSASHNVSIEGMGQIIFNADCNVNANVSIRGLFTITDNTAGMNSLTQTAVVNMTKINTEADTALSDYDPPTKTEMDNAIAALNDISSTDILTQVNLSTEIDDIATNIGALNDAVDVSTDVNDIYTVVSGLNDAVDTSTDINDILTNIAALNDAVDVSTDVNDILTNIAALNDAVDVSTDVNDILTNVAALNDISSTDVVTQTNAALASAITEPTALSMTKSLDNMIWALYGRFYHENVQGTSDQITKTSTGGEFAVRDITSSTSDQIIQKAT